MIRLKKDPQHVLNVPWRPVVSYIILGVLWIVFSDQLLGVLVQDPNLYASIQTYKGFLYVALTSVALYYLIKVDFDQIFSLNSQAMEHNQNLEAAYEESLALEEELQVKIADLIEKQKFIDVVLDYSRIAIVVWDLEGHIKEANAFYSQMIGLHRDELIGKRWIDIYVADDERELMVTMIETLKRGIDVHNIENKIIRKDGSVALTIWNNTLVKEYETDYYVISFGIDVTKEREHEHRAITLAYSDALTGLGNRAAFERDVNLLLEMHQHMCIFYFDIDHFNLLNDVHGHSYGDLFLKYYSDELIKQCPEMKIYRWSGDDFIAVKLCNESAEKCEAQMGEEAMRLMHITHKYWSIKEVLYKPTISIGAVQYPKDGENIDTLFKCLDYALFEAKRKGRGQYLRFDHQLHSVMKARVEIEEKFTKAIENDELQLFTQPIYNMDGTVLHSLEVLTRWPGEPNVTVAEFIEMAEETGLIIKLDDWVIKKAFEKVSKSAEVPLISINLSAQSIASPELIHKLEKWIHDYGVKPWQFEIEITEHSLLEDFEFAKNQLDQISKMGFCIALDDFGTRYSSLNYLANLPFNNLKIDKSYIDGLVTQNKSYVIVKQVIELAHSLGLDVIAEGIETEEQKMILIELGCDFAQGYLLGRPQKW